jgi:hypothetical protein
MLESESREARQRFDLAERFEPTAQLRARSRTPPQKRGSAMCVPHEERTDDESENLVSAGVREAHDSLESAYFKACARPLPGVLRAQSAEQRRVERFALDGCEHRPPSDDGRRA